MESIMALWALGILLSISLSSLLPFWDISELSKELHHICLHKLNFHTPWADIYKSLTCGKRLEDSPVKDIFIQGGLIHLTVVSGAHLLFLENFWKKLPGPDWLKTHGLFILLLLYTLASHFQPPVLRALFSFCLFRLSQSLKLFWNTNFILFLSGVFCLLYKVSWIHSISLQLSLLACLLQNFSKKSIKKCFFVYLFLLPILNRWQALHPFTVLINWILAPLISSVLFPLSFLSPFFPILYKVTDLLWTLCLHCLKLVKWLPSQSPLMNWHLPSRWIWPYIALIRFLIFIIDTFKRKSELYSQKPMEREGGLSQTDYP